MHIQDGDISAILTDMRENFNLHLWKLLLPVVQLGVYYIQINNRKVQLSCNLVVKIL